MEWKHRLFGPLAVVALLGGTAPLLLTGSASAAPSLGLLATSTSVSASPNVLVSSTVDPPPFTPESTTVTAVVHEAPLGGLLITPTGPVVFTAADSHGKAIALGSGNLSLCLLTLIQCSASVKSNAFYVDPLDATNGGTTWTVTASYGGDLLAKPSSNFTTVTSVTGDSQMCMTNNSCDVSSTNSDGSAGINLFIPCVANCPTDGIRQNSNAAVIHPTNTAVTSYSISTGFGYPTMTACPGGNTPLDGSGASQNADGSFPNSVVSATSPAEITYYLYGAAADAQHMLPDTTSFCYAQSAEFTQRNGTLAPFDASVGAFVGVPPWCPDSGGALPCSYGWSYTPQSGDTPSSWQISVDADVDMGAGKH
jgi:hypothetical protein